MGEAVVRRGGRSLQGRALAPSCRLPAYDTGDRGLTEAGGPAATAAAGSSPAVAGCDSAPSPPDLQSWWLRLRDSVAESLCVEGGNYLQLASVEDRVPRCRTVVFRRFFEPARRPFGMLTLALQFTTDARSEKVTQLMENPAAEAVWWFQRSSEQYRLAGYLELVGPYGQGELQAERHRQWETLKESSRQQFFSPQPGAQYDDGVAFAAAEELRTLGYSASRLPPPNFMLMLLWPHQVRYLRLEDSYCQVDWFDAVGDAWHLQRVNA